ncbi:hypothetical protein FA10DRAFT_289702 [Acaromyces ingoldii]|uniref:non-specific serine/threonine protein kinase n=1 Tax=Acaromyces ingoldii TaxID=215250 RepID=A0A316Y9K9_9BASI|nr:hypothetical protein FA10DRAFT_289702 [Acaromyces ingoldii]PWN86457.1 hypothetical protein FA10DRAFT_289702 [Acaromyces ingoldii]
MNIGTSMNIGTLQAKPLYLGRRLLGKGGFGKVYEVEQASDKKLFALKIVTVSTNAERRKIAAQEAALHSKLAHSNVIALLGHWDRTLIASSYGPRNLWGPRNVSGSEEQG